MLYLPRQPRHGGHWRSLAHQPRKALHMPISPRHSCDKSCWPVFHVATLHNLSLTQLTTNCKVSANSDGTRCVPGERTGSGCRMDSRIEAEGWNRSQTPPRPRQRQMASSGRTPSPATPIPIRGQGDALPRECQSLPISRSSCRCLARNWLFGERTWPRRLMLSCSARSEVA
jgi:hypothetical protein